MTTRKNRAPLAVTAGLACALGLAATLAGTPAVAIAEGQPQSASVSLASSVPAAQGHWVVTGEYTGGALERYWFKPDGTMARGELLRVVEGGTEYYAYATPDGPVVRGRWVDPSTGYIYFADNDGRLESAGWVVTGDYTGGALQRYWIDEDAHAAIPGFSEDGWDHLTTSEGYVARGVWTDPATGNMYLADNDGLLSGTGWVVSDAYGQGLQRYWVDPETHAVKPGFSDAGWAHYTTSAGYVLRGSVKTDNGVLIANNDGLLIEGVCDAGWAITTGFSSDIQRYYLVEVDGHLYARSGFFQEPLTPGAAKSWFYGNPETGYVVRGALATDSGVLLANNDGVLVENYASAGWYDSSDFEGSSQRYHLVSVGGHLYAQTGVFKATLDGRESEFYGDVSRGYVVRNANKSNPIHYNGAQYGSDSDGRLSVLVAKRSVDATLGTVTWGNDVDYLNALISLAEREGSKTDWFLTYDNELLRVVVLRRSGDTWKVEKTWNCVGATTTYTGKWEVLHKRESNWYSETYDWFQNGNGPNAWSTDYIWGIRAEWSQNHERWVDSPYGSGYEDCAAFHSNPSSPSTKPYWGNRGCCGLLRDNAKWIYDNIPIGSTVYEFDYSRVDFF